MKNPVYKSLLALAVILTVATSPASALVYFYSDFNGAADSATSVNGGTLTLGAYGLPSQFGMIRDDGNGGKALNIYGGEPFNGANSGAIPNLGAQILAGEVTLRMTGLYRTTPAYDNTPWAQTAQIQFQNTVGYFTYNAIVVSNTTSSWTPFQLDLDISGVDPAQLGQIQANFYIGGNDPGQFQVDNLTIETVPEPSTYALLALGAAGLGAGLVRRRR